MFTLTVTPPATGDPITLAVTGLPTGATSSFTPPTVPVGGGPTPITLTITVPARASAQQMDKPFGIGGLPVAMGLMLLPFAWRMRKSTHRWIQMVVLGIAGLTLGTGIIACGGGGATITGGGGTQTPQSYTLTVTATSGSLSQTTALTLTVQ